MERSHIIWNERNPEDKVKRGEVIHHINGDHFDDSPENHEKMLFGNHSRLHNVGNKYTLGLKHTEEAKRKISQANLGNTFGVGNINHLGKKHAEGTKKKMREAWAKKKEGGTRIQCLARNIQKKPSRK